MDFNKITAELDFVGSSVHNVEIKSDMIRISNSTKKSFGLDIKCSKPLVKDNEKFGKLLMQVEVSLFKEDEEEKLLAKIEAKVAEIKSNNPYPKEE